MGLSLVRSLLKSLASRNVEKRMNMISIKLLQTPGVIHPMKARLTSEPSDSTGRKRDAMNPGKCCWALRKKSANTHTHTAFYLWFFIHLLIQLYVCVSVCVGAGLPGDGGSVAMVTESASVKSEGQED